MVPALGDAFEAACTALAAARADVERRSA